MLVRLVNMSIKIILLCAVVATITEVRIDANTLFSAEKIQHKTSSKEDAFEILDKVKLVLEENIAVGLANMDKLSGEYKRMGDAIMKKIEKIRQYFHDITLKSIQAAVDKAGKLGIDITECNSDNSAKEFEEIMKSASESAKKLHEEYNRDSETDVNNGKEEVIGLKSGVDELEQMLLQCDADECFDEVSKRGRQQISLIPIRIGNIDIRRSNEIISNYVDLLDSLNGITFNISDEMDEIKLKVVSCIDEKINSSV